MLFDVLPVLLIFIAIVVIVAIVLRRLPDIATMNIETIAEAQSAATKRQLLVQRLERKLAALAKRGWEHTAKSRQSLKNRLTDSYQKLLEWEKKNRREEKPSAPVEDQTIESLLARAEQAREADEDEAEKLYLETIRLDHRNAKAYYGLGLLYWAGEQYEEARQALEYALRLDKDNPEIYATMAKLAVDDGRLVDARESYEKAAILDPENTEYPIGLGDVAISLKDGESAVSAFEAAVALEPMNPRCLDRLLEASILVGNKRLATATLKQFAEVNPENKKLVDFESRVAALPMRQRKNGK